MDANTPISVRPIASEIGPSANPVSTADAPMPKKNTAIIPERLQWSASQPEGSDPAPNAKKAPVARGRSSLYGRFHSSAIASTTVGKMSRSR